MSGSLEGDGPSVTIAVDLKGTAGLTGGGPAP